MDVIVIRCLAVVCKRVAGCAAGGGPRRLRSTGSTGEVCESVEVILEMDVCKVLSKVVSRPLFVSVICGVYY